MLSPDWRGQPTRATLTQSSANVRDAPTMTTSRIMGALRQGDPFWLYDQVQRDAGAYHFVWCEARALEGWLVRAGPSYTLRYADEGAVDLSWLPAPEVWVDDQLLDWNTVLYLSVSELAQGDRLHFDNEVRYNVSIQRLCDLLAWGAQCLRAYPWISFQEGL